MITSLCKKSTQAINLFARKKEGKINKMKAIKLIYFADRYHIRKYGRPIIGDSYWAMKLGPVGSETLNTANLSKKDLDASCLKYAQEFLGHPKGDIKLQNIISKKEVDLGVFSQTDIEALEATFNEFGDKDQFELADESHKYPEWLKHEKEINKGRKRVKMEYSDFFNNSLPEESSIFKYSDEHLGLMKDVYEEDLDIQKAIG
ncbi:MAG: Panacea domain-containing protein [Candidatus Colwellbacteria bacterium]|jgi:uncharacterized phage-associated protein|nr:Panacea domain-containing protein [Candidatus Colwellbacteria bacterium]